MSDASGRLKFGFAVALGVLATAAGVARADHGAHAWWGQDNVDGPFSFGTSNPTGTYSINVNAGVPGYENNIPNSQPVGSVSLASPPTNAPLLVGIAIQVTDAAGLSHSLSTQNDPALNDILLDLQERKTGRVQLILPLMKPPSAWERKTGRVQLILPLMKPPSA